MAPSLEVFVPNALWLLDYSVKLGGARFKARMTVIKLRSGGILVHSPFEFDDLLAAEVAALRPVAAIIAPAKSADVCFRVALPSALHFKVQAERLFRSSVKQRPLRTLFPTRPLQR